MNFGAHTSKTRKDTVKIAVSVVERKSAHMTDLFARNTNLSALASETMWYQPIGIELLAVLLLFLPSSVSDECYNHVFLQKEPSRSS